MRLLIMRSFLVSTGLLLAFSGGFILWQLAAQPSNNGCYTFPFGFGALASAYQGGCPYNSIPNYYSGDVGLILIVLGFGLTLVRFRSRRVEVG